MTFDPSYVALCRELRLEREWVDGDYFIDDEPERVLGGVRFAAMVSEVQIQGRATWGDSEIACEHSIWLPRLDQWLAMLIAAGAVSIRLWREGEVYGVEVIVPGIGSPSETASSWEEAAARAWCAVTGRMVSG